MRLTSFGCSFIFGNDLADHGGTGDTASASRLTWPALVANNLGYDYVCRARGGAGNLVILNRLLMELDREPMDFCIIGWTWIERFDYIDPAADTNAAPMPWNTICPQSPGVDASCYYRYLHSELRDKLASLIYINTAIDLLKQRDIPFVMTYIDNTVMDQTWHAPTSVTYLQKQVLPHLTRFDDMDFLTWSRANHFPISTALHPLEQAHTAASEIMMPIIDAILHRA